MSAQPFVVYGKTDNTRYSVRTADGHAVCTCAYNYGTAFDGGREEMAQLIADALNAYAPAEARVAAIAQAGAGNQGEVGT